MGDRPAGQPHWSRAQRTMAGYVLDLASARGLSPGRVLDQLESEPGYQGRRLESMSEREYDAVAHVLRTRPQEVQL